MLKEMKWCSISSTLEMPSPWFGQTVIKFEKQWLMFGGGAREESI